MVVSSEELQRTLGDGRDAWKPHEGETWDAFVRRKAPRAPAFWQPFDRAHYNRALDEAVRRGERRETVRALVLPTWVANNEDEVASDDEWRRRLLVVSESNDDVLLEIDLRTNEAPCACAELTIVRGSFVVPLRAYASDPHRATRFGRFSVIETTLRAVVERVLDGGEIELVPSPKRLVPAFSMQYEPAFEDGALYAAARRITNKLSFDGSE